MLYCVIDCTNNENTIVLKNKWENKKLYFLIIDINGPIFYLENFNKENN